MSDAPPGIRRAAAVLLHRRRDDGTLEVLLGRRARERSFFPGYWALIGGGLEEEDAKELGVDPWRLSALRELFEETGILLTPDALPSRDALEAQRKRLLAHEASFPQVLDALGVTPDVDILRSAGRLLTPEIMPLRFDTRYLAAPAPRDAPAPDAGPSELGEARWWTVEDALAAWERFDAPIAPPVLLLLEALQAHGLDEGLRRFDEIDTSTGEMREPYIQVHPGVRMVPLRAPTLPPNTHVNTVLVGRERVVVIDPGTPEEGERDHLASVLDAHLQEHDGEVAGVLLTHHHGDHVASAAWVADRYDTPIMAHPETAKRVDVEVHRILEDGDEVDLGTWEPTGDPWRVRALHTPGHAPGHLAFQDTRRNLVVAGDLVAGTGTVLVDPEEGDMAAYMESLQRLADLDAPLVVPGHGPFVTGEQAIFQATLDHRRMREGKVLDALAPEARSLDDLLPIVYGDVDPRALPLARRSLLAHLQKLEAEGRAVREGDGWRLA